MRDVSASKVRFDAFKQAPGLKIRAGVANGFHLSIRASHLVGDPYMNRAVE